MRQYRPSVSIAALGAAVLLLSACSSGGGSSSSASPTDASTGSSVATSTAPTPPASSIASSTASSGTAPTKAQLSKINIQAADLPAGFTSSAPDAADQNDDITPALRRCTGVTGAPAGHTVATAYSNDFDMGTLSVSSKFSSYRSQRDVTADAALLKSPKINQCLTTAYKNSLVASLGGQGKVIDADLTLTLGSNGGPSNIAALASGTIGVTQNNKDTIIYLGIAFVTGPQLDGTLVYVGLGAGLDDTTTTKTLTLVAARAQRP